MPDTGNYGDLPTPTIPDQHPPQQHISQEQKITPFEVSGGLDEDGKPKPVDYDKLIQQFGATPLTQDLLERFERVTGCRPHRFMRRGIVFSHRNFEVMLDCKEKGFPFYIYTGRGPSSDSMHIGHATPFELTKFLQDAFDVPLVIMLTDDEKFLHTPNLELEDAHAFAHKNADDIIAIGFDPSKTFIFVDTDYVRGEFYKNMLRMEKRTTINSVKGTFGFNDSNNVGEFRFCATQSASSFSTSFPHIFGVRKVPCLIPCAIDQDPYFRQCREHAEKLGYHKPSILHSSFLPALGGPASKMSASKQSSAIFLSDTAREIKTKIIKEAFSGGQMSIEEHRKVGGRTQVDVAYQYLRFFMEDDDELEQICDAYEKGDLLTGELKAICIKTLQEYVAGFQERRRMVTDDIREEFMRERPLTFSGNMPSAVLDAGKEPQASPLPVALSKHAAKKAAKKEKLAIRSQQVP